MGRNNADFHGLKLSHSLDDGYVDIAAHLNGEQVGFLSLEPSGRVEDMGVNDEHQQKGVGTAMWNHALKLHQSGQIPKPPKHSNYRTPEGDAFAKSVGGKIPKNTAEWATTLLQEYLSRGKSLE